jgi:3-methyladenine DNA glycosylase AlkC
MSSYQLKNMYNQAFISDLSQAVLEAFPSFDGDRFHQLVFNDQWDSLELKQRMRHITRCMHLCLTTDYEKNIHILKTVSLTMQKTSHNGFCMIFCPDYVEVYGVDHPEISLPALEFLTEFSSSEFAIRPFLINHQENTFKVLYDWSKSSNHHVRRLSSEGCRPRLPWAQSLPLLKKDPAPIFPILNTLKADESEYVRKSVANNINDISKDHPKLALDFIKAHINQNNKTNWILKHGCRTLLKKGNVEALTLFGFPQLSPENISFEINKPCLKIGEKLEFKARIEDNNLKNQNLRLEYAVTFVKKRNLTTRKVFQITQTKAKDNVVTLEKRHAFADLSTRKHHPGTHTIELIINGSTVAKQSFELDHP